MAVRGAVISAAVNGGATHRHDGSRPMRRQKGQRLGRLA